MFEFNEGRKTSNRPLSDLAIERHKADTSIAGVHYEKHESGGFTVERLSVESDEGAESIKKPKGRYSTITLPRMDMLYDDDIDDAANEVAAELCYMIEGLGISPDRLLIVGLGNQELTSDSIGPKAADSINATMHISEYDKRMFGELECSEIAVIKPGIMAKSGIKTFDTVSAVAKEIDPDALIVIDSLSSRSRTRLGSTIQICDTGIAPGSGIGARNTVIDKAHIGIPVISVGVPTVINSALLFSDAEEEIERRMFGDDQMFVSPKEIDTIASVASKIIARGINQAFGII